MNRQDGAGGRADDLLRDGAHEQAEQRGMTMRANHEELAAILAHVAHDLGAGDPTTTAVVTFTAPPASASCLHAASLASTAARTPGAPAAS